MPPLLIGLSGKRGSGKSTLARNLTALLPGAVEVRPLALPLKLMCRDLLGVPWELLNGSDDDKRAPTAFRQRDMPHWCHVCAANDLSDPWQDKGLCGLSVRELMQQLGTEVFRKLSPRCWINSLLADWHRSTADHMVVDDVRFVDEADAIRGAGGLMVRLKRGEAAAADAHASEMGLDDYGHFDVVVEDSPRCDPSIVALWVSQRIQKWQESHQ